MSTYVCVHGCVWVCVCVCVCVCVFVEVKNARSSMDNFISRNICNNLTSSFHSNTGLLLRGNLSPPTSGTDISKSQDEKPTFPLYYRNYVIQLSWKLERTALCPEEKRLLFLLIQRSIISISKTEKSSFVCLLLIAKQYEVATTKFCKHTYQTQ